MLYRGLLLTALAGTTMFTSCGDDFDDSELKNRLDQVENRLTQLENKLKSEVEALKEMLSGTTIASATKADGVWTIVLSDGQTITVGDNGSAPLVSVVEENGTYYWTINGEVMTDASGEKISVEGGAPSLCIDASTKEWLVSPDGGKTWFGTGITGENASIFQKVSADSDYVYFTLADGTELAIAKGEAVKNGFSLKLMSGGKQYFEAGQTKSVEIDMTGVKKASVIGKPEGWKASVANGKVSITAPAETAANAEKNGVIVLMAVSNDGRSDIAEISVLIGKPHFNLVVSGVNNIVLTHNTKVDPNNWDATYFGAILSAMKLSDFSEQAAIDYVTNNNRLMPVEEDTTTTLEALIGGAPERGESYVVWALCYDKWGDMDYYQPENVVYSIIVVPSIELTYTAAFDDAQISVIAKGVSKYVGGVKNKADFNLADEAANITEFGASDYPQVNGNYEGPLSRFAMQWGSPNQLVPGGEYIVYALPAGPRGTVYTPEDFYVWEIKLPEVTMGGSASVAVDDLELSLQSISATLTPSSDTYKFYCQYLTADQYAEYADDAALLKFLLKLTAQTETYKFSKQSMTPDTKGYIVAVAIDRNGKAGQIVKVEANTLAMSFNSITVTAELIAGNQTAYIKPSAQGGDVVKYLYWWKEKEQFDMDYVYKGDVKALESAMALMGETPQWGYYTVQSDEIPADGIKVPATGAWPSTLNNGKEYLIAVIGFDAQGLPTHLFTGYVTPDVEMSGKLIRNTAENYLDGIPFIKSVSCTGANSGYISCEMEMGAGCKEYYVYIQSDGIIPSNALERTRQILGMGTKYTASGSFTGNYLFLDSSYIYFTWVDNNGDTHAAYELKTFRGTFIGTGHADYAKNKPTATKVNDTSWSIDTNGSTKCYAWVTADALPEYEQFRTSDVMKNGEAVTGAVTAPTGSEKLYVVWVDADGNTHSAAELAL